MTASRRHEGFTLVELLVIIGIIAIASGILVTSMRELFAMGAAAQAENIIDAQLRVARSLAIRDRRYTGVHFAPDANNPNHFWAAIVQEQTVDPITAANPSVPTEYANPNGKVNLNAGDPNLHIKICGDVDSLYKLFVHVPDIPPARLPDDVTVGRCEDPNASVWPNWRQDWATFTVIFAPDGRLVTQTDEAIPRYVKVNGSDFYTCELFALHDPNIPGSEQWRIWDPNVNEKSDRTRAVVIARVKALESMTIPEKMAHVQSITPMPIGPYTGGLLRAN